MFGCFGHTNLDSRSLCGYVFRVERILHQRCTNFEPLRDSDPSFKLQHRELTNPLQLLRQMSQQNFSRTTIILKNASKVGLAKSYRFEPNITRDFRSSRQYGKIRTRLEQ